MTECHLANMLDTIVLLLHKDTFQITEPDKFAPSARWAFQNTLGESRGVLSKQNPKKKELLAGVYKPRLTLSHRYKPQGEKEITLRVEVSLPKLLFGNNFNELKSKDFSAVTKKLAASLKEMGIEIAQKDLAQADVLTVHYSKNIALKDGSTPYHFINKIKEANISLSLDVNQTDYRNEGHSYRWHCNAYEVVFYDKIKDLEKAKQSDKRTLEKDNTVQLDIFDQLANRKKKLEILRMEVRLNKRQKMKQLFTKLGIKLDFMFKGLFKPVISRKVLLHYFDELESKRPPLYDYRATSDKSMLTSLILNNPVKMFTV